jgi:hypothetical protein
LLLFCSSAFSRFLFLSLSHHQSITLSLYHLHSRSYHFIVAHYHCYSHGHHIQRDHHHLSLISFLPPPISHPHPLPSLTIITMSAVEETKVSNIHCCCASPISSYHLQ